jgi:hypothetical protein
MLKSLKDWAREGLSELGFHAHAPQHASVAAPTEQRTAMELEKDRRHSRRRKRLFGSSSRTDLFRDRMNQPVRRPTEPGHRDTGFKAQSSAQRSSDVAQWTLQEKHRRKRNHHQRKKKARPVRSRLWNRIRGKARRGGDRSKSAPQNGRR